MNALRLDNTLRQRDVILLHDVCISEQGRFYGRKPGEDHETRRTLYLLYGHAQIMLHELETVVHAFEIRPFHVQRLVVHAGVDFLGLAK